LRLTYAFILFYRDSKKESTTHLLNQKPNIRMRHTIKTMATVLLASMIFTACTKNVAEPPQEEISAAVMQKITDLGFGTNGIQKTDEGYLVEGDILLTDEYLNNSNNQGPELVYANEEHYRTTNTVTGLPRTLTIKVSSGSPSYFSTALTEAVRRYNAENLRVRFQVVSSTSSSNITVVTFYQVSNTLGSAGFPSGGNPYSQIRMNTYWYSASTNINYLATIIAHEMGHCIGFRHTDYMNRAYSCGTGGNEGSAGVGAIHIPGTPTGPSAGSWMLACSNGGNRPFTTADRTALNYLY
jgi:Dual-action HEIGH metallo-peptidase